VRTEPRPSTLARLSIEVVNADARLAREAASVRARRKLKLPDAYTLATAPALSVAHGC
jgi:predicted nucleic acid-binding protein